MKKKIVYAPDCTPCEMCGEPICPVCNEHYAECNCPGPHSEDDEDEDSIDNTVNND